MSRKRRKVLAEVQAGSVPSPQVIRPVQVVGGSEVDLREDLKRRRRPPPPRRQRDEKAKDQDGDGKMLQFSASEDGSSQKRQVQAFRLALALISVAIYLNSLQCGFVYDDRRAILENRNVYLASDDESDTSSNETSSTVFQRWLWRPLTDDFWGAPMSHPGSHRSWRPLVTLTYKLQAHSTGLQSAFAFHLANLVLHLLVVEQVFQVFCSLAPGGGCKLTVGAGKPSPAQVVLATPAIVGALLFACHPVHVEAVTSLVGRAELMGALFALLSFRRALSHIRPSGCGAESNWRHLLAASLWALAACLSKENAGLGAILINLWLALWSALKLRRRRKLDESCQAASQRRQLGLALAMLALMFGLVAVRIQLDAASGASQQGLGATAVAAEEDEKPEAAATTTTTRYVGPLKLPNFSHLDNPLARGGRQFCLRNLNELAGSELGGELGSELGPHKSDTGQCSSGKVIDKLEQWRLLTRLYLPLASLYLLLWPSQLSYDWPLGSLGGLVKGLGEARFLAALAAYLSLSVFLVLWLRELLAVGREEAEEDEEEAEEEEEDETTSETGSVKSADSGFVDSRSAAGADRKPAEEASGLKAASATLSALPRPLERTQDAALEDAAAALELTKLDQLGWPLALLLLAYLPASNLLLPAGFLLAERTLYLPSVGVCWLGGLLVDQLSPSRLLSCLKAGRLSTAPKSRKIRRPLAAVGGRQRNNNDMAAKLAFILPLLILGAHRSRQRNADWLDDASLYRSNLRESPAKSAANLASLMPAPEVASSVDSNADVEQERLYRAALREEPQSAELHYNLALVLHRRARSSEGGRGSGGSKTEPDAGGPEYHYRMAMSLRENFALAALNLAAYQNEQLHQLEAAERTLASCWQAMSQAKVRQPHQHVQIQIECLIGALRMRLAKQTGGGGCPARWLQLALDKARWLRAEGFSGARAPSAAAHSPLGAIGDLHRQLATIHWLRWRCGRREEPLDLLHQAWLEATRSRVSIAAAIYMDSVDSLLLSAKVPNHQLAAERLAAAIAKEERLLAEGGGNGEDLAQLYGRLAEIHQDLLGKPSEAARALDRALELAPSSHRLANRAARLAHELGQLDKSERLYLRALLMARGRDKLAEPADYNKRLASAYANHGAILQVRGRHHEARSQYRRALELDPANGAARANLGIK